jgi:hypothetical protein
MMQVDRTDHVVFGISRDVLISWGNLSRGDLYQHPKYRKILPGKMKKITGDYGVFQRTIWGNS